MIVAATDIFIVPFVVPVLILSDANAVLILAIVPVTTKRVLVPVSVNPLAAVKPVIVLRLNVVPVGNVTKLIDVSKVAVGLNPLNTNPLASCPFVFTEKDLATGAVTLCPVAKNDNNKNKIVTNLFILLFYN